MTAEIVAGIYCRISLASTGDTTKTGDQERICRDLCAARGWRVHDVYTDHAKSAWQPSRKRKEWDRMLADVEAGHVTAIVVYHGDRLLRTHEDLLKLINLARTRGITLASPAGERDLGNYDDQFILEIEASMAKRESANTSRRRKAQYERWRREGKVRTGGRGGRAFAFETDSITHVPAEAELFREAIRMVLSGISATEIARWLNGRGIVTPAGNSFSCGPVRAMLMRPRYAGLMPDGVSKAAWAPVVDREKWETACAVLDARAAGIAPVSSARKYLLSGIARCGMPGCGAPMQIGGHAGKRGYRCSKNKHMFRTAEPIEEYVAGATVGYLNRDDWPQPQVTDPDHASEFAALTTARAELETLIADHESPNVRLLLTRLDRLDARLAQLRARAGDGVRLDLIGKYRGITDEEFAALPLSVRRALVCACLEITVLPSGRRGPGFHPEYVELRRR